MSLSRTFISTGAHGPVARRVRSRRRHGSAIVALRFFFKVTLERADLVQRLTFVRKPRKAPIVLSPEEVVRLLEAAPGVSSWTRTARWPPQPSQKVAGFRYETHECSGCSARQKHRHRDPAEDHLQSALPPR